MKYALLLILTVLPNSEIALAGKTITGHDMIIKIIIKAAKAAGVPANVLVSMCYNESTFDSLALNKNDGNEDSVGVCQLQLTTAKEVIKKLGNLIQYDDYGLYIPELGKKDLYDPRINSAIAAFYLKSLIKRYGTVDKAIVAYNLGHYSPNYTKYIIKVKNIMKFMKKAVINVR